MIMYLRRFFKNRSKVIFVIIIPVSLLIIVLYFFFKSMINANTISEPVVVPVDKGVIREKISDLRSAASDQDLSDILSVCRDWESDYSGKIYTGQVNPDLDVSSSRSIFRLMDSGFKRYPLSMVLLNTDNLETHDIGVKFVYDIVQPETDSRYYESVEYGVCYFYSEINPDNFSGPGRNTGQLPYSAQNINYLENVYDDLYIYAIWSSNSPMWSSDSPI